MDDMSNEMFDAIKAVVNFSRYDDRYASLANRKGSSATLREVEAQRKEYFEKRFAEIAVEHGVDVGELRLVLQQMMEPKMAAEVRDLNDKGYQVEMPNITSPGRT